MRDISIRPEREPDFPAIHELVKIAFSTAPVSDGDEQEFVRRLRAGGGYIPELALVAEKRGELVGHIMLTRIPYSPGVKDADKEDLACLLLAPLCVKLEERKLGLGSALVREAFARARGLGGKAVFLLGDKAYYQRFGFQEAGQFGLGFMPDSLPAQHVLACELTAEALAGRNGTIKIV